MKVVFTLLCFLVGCGRSVGVTLSQDTLNCVMVGNHAIFHLDGVDSSGSALVTCRVVTAAQELKVRKNDASGAVLATVTPASSLVTLTLPAGSYRLYVLVSGVSTQVEYLDVLPSSPIAVGGLRVGDLTFSLLLAWFVYWVVLRGVEMGKRK